MSEWNKLSGNWSFEERDFSKWGEERLGSLLKSENEAVGTDAEHKLHCTYDCSGDFGMTIVFIRGKKRVGYEIEGLTLKVELKDSNGSELFSGRMVINELAVEDGYEGFSLSLKQTPSGCSAETKNVDLAKRLTRERFTKCFEALIAELAAKV